MLRYVSFFFMVGSLYGVITVYFPPFLASLGFTDTERSWLLAVPPLFSVLFPLVWGQLADRLGLRLWLVRFLLFALAGVFTAFYFVEAFVPVLLALVAMAIFRSGILPLADALALSNLSPRQYPWTQFANGLSGLVGLLLFAFLLADRAPGAGWAVRVTHIAIGIAALWSFVLPGKSQAAGKRPSFQDGLILLRDSRIVLFLISISIYWIGMGTFETLLEKHTTQAGFGARTAGYAMAVGIFAELVVLSGAKRVGFDLIAISLSDQPRARRLMAVVMIGTAARWFLSAIAPNEAVFLALQLLHGLTFGAFILLAVGRMLVLVPEPLRATGQALLLSSLAGVGSMLGSLITGPIAEQYSTSRGLQAGGVAVVVALVFFLLTSRESKTA